MAKKNTIQYITFASLGNTTDFGDLSAIRDENTATGCDGTKGVVMGGGDVPGVSAPGLINVIEYITISTTGNASDFGDLLGSYETGGAASGSAS